MIIEFPTGFYKTVLPKIPSDNTSVTFTISNTIPPRTELLFPKLPVGVEIKQRLPDLSFDRSQVGDLIFSISEADHSEIDNNSRLLEIGQVLEFTNASPVSVDPMFVSKLTEVRHDTNKFNYAAMGLDDKDVAVLESFASQKLADLQNQLNIAKKRRSDSEQITSEKQKLINDLNRNIAALEVIVDNVTETDEDVLEVLAKLIKKRQTAFEERDAAITIANESAAEAYRLVDELRTMAAVVK
jgi:hypothetical protein